MTRGLTFAFTFWTTKAPEKAGRRCSNLNFHGEKDHSFLSWIRGSRNTSSKNRDRNIKVLFDENVRFYFFLAIQPIFDFLNDMMDPIVQLIQNALCCVKDLKLYKTTLLWDPSYNTMLLRGFPLPYPMDETTPLEWIIALTQLYACISGTKQGISLVLNSAGKLRRITHLLEERGYPKTMADRIIHQSLLQDADNATRSMMIGCCLAPIGIAFWWLCVSSLHVLDWFGGNPALIHALEVMNICLVPLLYYMIVDGMENLRTANQVEQLLTHLQSSSTNWTTELMTLATYEAMTGWVPFWDDGVDLFTQPPDPVSELKRMADEVKNVERFLSILLPSGDEEAKQEGPKEDRVRTKTLRQIERKLQGDIPVLRLEGYREFLYFCLNFLAFYGYWMGPLCFYYEEEETQPFHIRSLKFGYQNDRADWYGNFTGDLMWTIEPIVILISPMVLSLVRSQKTKVKSD